MSDFDKRQRPLPLTETLVFDIVDYLLKHEGYGYSTQISSFMVSHKPRRYTSREVVGILRNRPMFKHAKVSERKGGIRWRLDINSLERYLYQKGFESKAESRGFYEDMIKLKEKQIFATKRILDNDDSQTINELYDNLSKIWA